MEELRTLKLRRRRIAIPISILHLNHPFLYEAAHSQLPIVQHSFGRKTRTHRLNRNHSSRGSDFCVNRDFHCSMVCEDENVL